MTDEPADRTLAHARRRWSQLLGERPELSRAIDLQRRMVTIQLELLARLPRMSWPPTAVERAAQAVSTGMPAFTALPDIHLHAVPFDAALSDVLTDVAHAGAGPAADKIRDAVTAGGLDVDRLLTASLRRSEPGMREVAAGLGLNLAVAWYAAEIVTAPLAVHLRDALFSTTDPVLARGIAAWRERSCPFCGSPPAYAEVVAGDRVLRCTYCSSSWTTVADRCVQCGAAEELARVVPDPARPGRRLELCRRCGVYLKTLDVERLTAFPLLVVEDLGSSDLDHAAGSHGFRRQPFGGMPQGPG